MVVKWRPQDMRRRLRKGGGGAGGNSASLETLMDKLKFRGRPKVVDLTSERKVAEKVQEVRDPSHLLQAPLVAGTHRLYPPPPSPPCPSPVVLPPLPSS